MIVKLLTEHHLEFLSLKGSCRGSPESTHVKMSHCWKSHATAQLSSYVSVEHWQKCWECGKLPFKIMKNWIPWHIFFISEMDSLCIKQTICKVLNRFQCGKYLEGYVLYYFLEHCILASLTLFILDTCTLVLSCADPEGGTRGPDPPPPKKSQNIGFLNNTGLDPLKITKLPTQHSITSTPAKRHLNGASLAGWWWPAYSGIWILPPLIN